MRPIEPPGDSFWIEEPRLLAGPYPGDPDEVRRWEKLGAFLDLGIRRFIDLTEPGEHESYEGALVDIAAERGLEVTHHRLPIPDVSVPSAARMREILDELEEDMTRPEGVYVHCRGGAGRTGTVVGCYLIESGLDPAEALAAIAADRSGTSRAGWSSPETDEQRGFVLGWRPGAR